MFIKDNSVPVCRIHALIATLREFEKSEQGHLAGSCLLALSRSSLGEGTGGKEVELSHAVMELSVR